MKTILKFIFALLFIAGGLQAQVTLYNQTFNDSSAGLPANWTNIGSCNWVKDNTNQSSGYANSSGGRNLYANCNGNSEITVSNIVTTGYASLTVTFGARKGATQLNNLEFYWSSNGSVYNLISFTDVTNNATWALVNGGVAITLPAGCENQANLRFKFKINNSASAADYRIDDFRLTGTAPPTKLYITSVIGTGCSFPQVGIPFSVTVQSRDINNNAANVTSATTIQLSSTPSGITGTTSGIIAFNTSSVTISGVIYNTAGGITITATPTAGMTGLTPYTTGTINVKALPTGLAFNNLQVTGIVNNVHPSFQVRATPLDSGSACFNGQVTLVQVSGPAGGLTGTLVVNASGGQATFGNVIFTQVGVYQIKATASGLTDAPTTTVTIGTAPVAFTQMIVPLNMQGKSGTNNERVHSAFLAEITNLNPNTIYRYYTRAVSTTDNVTEVGNSIYVYSGSPFIRSTSPNLTTAGDYGTFTSDALGKFRGWFMLEPTGDTRFAAGQQIKCRVVVDGGNNGVATYTFTTTQTIKCLTFGPTLGSPTEGTALSLFSPSAGTQDKNFLLFYRGDTAGSGGRPVAINVIESDGLNLSGVADYLPLYRTGIDGQTKACLVLIPNLLPAGIITIVERSISGGLLMSITDAPGDIVSTANSPNGIWPPGVSTINPTGGTTPISIQPVFILVAITQNSSIASEYKLSQNYPNPFNPSTKIDFSLPNSSNIELKVYDVLGKEVYTLLNEEFAAGKYSVDFNASKLPSGMYFYKLTSGEFSEVKKMALIK